MSQINCPTCGAKTDSVVANCEYCGVEFARAQTLTPQEFVAAVGRAVVTAKGKVSGWVDEERAESTTIMSIPIPSDISTLTAFFMFCHSNLKTGMDGATGSQQAWRAKAKGSYDMLRLASLNNPQLSAFLEEFKSSYTAEAIKAANSADWRFIGIIFAVLAAIFLFVYFASK